MKGSTTPRIYTKPLPDPGETSPAPGPCGCGCSLTPERTRGFEAVEFAEQQLGFDLMPWQRWVLIHGLETRPDGTYRFRKVLLLVSRQAGKTSLAKILALWRMIDGTARMVLGTSTGLDTSMETWESTIELLEDSPLSDEILKIRRAAVNISLTLNNRARYVIRAANRKTGRSLSVDLAILDELREHLDWSCMAAVDGTMTARPDPQAWMLSNAGDDRSIVLEHFRNQGIAAIENDEEDGLALFEYSGEDECELDDREAWAQACPALGYTITERTLEEKLKLPPAVFRTEYLCQSVPSLDEAIPENGWKDCRDPGNLSKHRDRVVLCFDASPDDRHASLVAAAMTENGRVRVEVVAAWDSITNAENELYDHIDRVNPAKVVWYPAGPAAALKAKFDLIDAEAISGDDVFAACQGLSTLVAGRKVLHSSDPLLDAHVLGAKKLYQGDRWRFTRRDVGHVDAAYAAAGAIHVARTLPPPKRKREGALIV